MNHGSNIAAFSASLTSPNTKQRQTAMQSSAQSFKVLGSRIATRGEGEIDDRTFISFHGATPEVVSDCRENIHEMVDAKPKHLLWAMMFMKLCLSEDGISALLLVSKPTVRKWVCSVIESLALASLTVVCATQLRLLFKLV